MDRLNLENRIDVSEAICAAAQARTHSRGAHFREDFPETSDLASSHCTLVRQNAEGLDVSTVPVAFTRIRPRESLLEADA